EGQTIYPTNAASKTLEEYLAFVEYHKPAPTACNISSEELSRFGYPSGTRKNQLIQEKISESARSMNIVSGNSLLKAPKGKLENGYYQNLAHGALLAHLGLLGKLPLEEAWKISCLFQPALGQVLKEPLSKIYGNPLLGISIALDEKSLNTDGYGITATYQNDTPDITFAGIYNISNSKAVIARIKVTMTMADARTGQAQFTCVKI
ncbi:MAG TPA: hypothetical protein VHK67_07685, partial [Rhabdochlamydiaceae bacterium]|nr:hypothetical protein [Rhabdochlamydiaceae bacterium]